MACDSQSCALPILQTLLVMSGRSTPMAKVVEYKALLVTVCLCVLEVASWMQYSSHDQWLCVANIHDHQTDLGVLESPTLEAATVALAASPQERAAIQSKFKEVSFAASVCVGV